VSLASASAQCVGTSRTVERFVECVGWEELPLRSVMRAVTALRTSA
jgi:hypothetical protein